CQPAPSPLFPYTTLFRSGADGAILVAADRGHEKPLRLVGALRAHADDAVDGVRAPERSTRTADDLDGVDVLEHHVLPVPEHAARSEEHTSELQSLAYLVC